jgi:crossover junction endonuclease EME1
MPVEVIDLISSPEQPKPVITKVNSTAISRPNPPTKSHTYEPKENWFTLSSEDEDNALDRPAKPALDSYSELTERPKSNTITTKPLQASQTAKFGKDFFFLSDDFDSTVNLDDSFDIDAPSAKKRRLSSSPPAVSCKTKVPRTSGFNRSISNIESSSKYGIYKSSAESLRRSKAVSTVLESDPIVFTSSPDPFADVARRRREKRKEILAADDDDDIFELGKPRKEVLEDDEDDIFELGKQRKGILGDNEDDDIFELRPSKEKVEKKFTYDTLNDSSDIDLPDLDQIPVKGIPRVSSKTSSKTVLDNYNAEREKERKAKEKAQKAAERTVSKQTKQASKEAEKERKRLEREEKAREKERAAELAKVNIVRTNKQRSSHEMIVDLPSKLSDSILAEQVLKLLGKSEIRHSNWESSIPVIKWRREVSSAYNEEMGQWEPVAPHIKPENHVMFIMSAKEFVELATGKEGKDIDAHVLGLKAKFTSCDIIYLIEGLAVWMRKNRAIQNRKFTEAVRNQMSQDEPAATQRARKKKEQEEYVDEDLVEDALLRLQVMHGTLIHHTAAMIETAEWIVVFTQHISTIPYR